MRKVHAFLYYVHMTTNNEINSNFLYVLIMNFYMLVWFHIWRCLCISLSVRVSNSGHFVTYARQYCSKILSDKIYRCMTEGSKQHSTLLHNTTIIHTKTLFAPAYHLCKNNLPKKKLSHSSLLNPRVLYTPSSTSK